MRRTVIALSLIFIALVPFIRLALQHQEEGFGVGFGAESSIKATSNAVIANSEQLMGFMLKKENILNFFYKNYDDGFFVLGDENKLFSTMLALEALSRMGYIEQLSNKMATEIVGSSRSYYNTNKNLEIFSPSQAFAYYRILTLLDVEFGAGEINELLDEVLSFKVSGSGFSRNSAINSSKADVKETYYAVRLLNEAGHSFSGMKVDIVKFLNETSGLSEAEYLMYRETSEILGVKSSIPREAVISCLVKEYIPLLDEPECLRLLKESRIYLYIPSLLLLIGGYILLVAK